MRLRGARQGLVTSESVWEFGKWALCFGLTCRVSGVNRSRLHLQQHLLHSGAGSCGRLVRILDLVERHNV